MMRRPTHSEMASDPYGAGLTDSAMYCSFDAPVLIALDVNKVIFEQGRKQDVVAMVRPFVNVIRSPSHSPLFYALVPSLSALKRLEDAFYDDKLPGIERIELACATIGPDRMYVHRRHP